MESNGGDGKRGVRKRQKEDRRAEKRRINRNDLEEKSRRRAKG